jgi:hypothetical protein
MTSFAVDNAIIDRGGHEVEALSRVSISRDAATGRLVGRLGSLVSDHPDRQRHPVQADPPIRGV